MSESCKVGDETLNLEGMHMYCALRLIAGTVHVTAGSTVSALVIDDLGFMPQDPQEVPPTAGFE
jgi:hypothetical protein